MMINVKTVGIYVSDKQRALDFYVDKMGFEKRRDDPMSPEARWIEVAPKGAETVLVLYTPQGLEDRIGSFAGVVFKCDDIRATYEELRERGVEFTEEPTMQPWGMMQAQFKDIDGNAFVLVEQ